MIIFGEPITNKKKTIIKIIFLTLLIIAFIICL